LKNLNMFALSAIFFVLPALASSLSIVSYNIMDSGFADSSGRYDPVADRVPGNLTNFISSQSQHIDVLGLIETAAWSTSTSSSHPSIADIASSFGFEHFHLGSNICLMSHVAMNVLEEGNPLIAEIEGVVYVLTAMSAISYPEKKDDFKTLADKVNEYKDTPTVLMGDLNAISALDSPRYNETLLCGNGTYNKEDQSGEYVQNFCLEDKNGDWKLDYSPMNTLMSTASDLVDLCYYSGGFFDYDADHSLSQSMCAFSNPTLLIHMTGDYDFTDGGSHAHTHAMAKIDYILANRMMMKHMRFHHSTVIRTFQSDGCSDHYPIEATFLK